MACRVSSWAVCANIPRQQCFPDADGPVLAMETCFFENTPDRAPIIDQVEDGVWVIGGFSGHGFKYASVMGEIARDLLVGGEIGFDLVPFRAGRFLGSVAPPPMRNPPSYGAAS